MSKVLPEWDKEERLVGDVMILERAWSCEWFLLICRRLASAPEKIDGRVNKALLSLWEKLLFTRDFHGKYHGLWYKDNFPELFAALERDEKQISKVIESYVKDGFRSGHTDDLQAIVREYIKENKSYVINNAYYWWKNKMIYALYKYETSHGANIREVMQGTISVEHILPQDWLWIKDEDATLIEKTDEEWDQFKEGINGIINGVGNLLLIKPGENTQASNKHPKDKYYNPLYSGGSYKLHDENRMDWEDSSTWGGTIRDRGNLIYQFILEHLIDTNISDRILSK